MELARSVQHMHKKRRGRKFSTRLLKMSTTFSFPNLSFPSLLSNDSLEYIGLLSFRHPWQTWGNSIGSFHISVCGVVLQFCVVISRVRSEK
jgi:hypothetical protein